MTVSSSVASQMFSCDGATAVFPCPFRVLESTDLSVYLITVSTGEAVELSNGVEFTVANAGTDSNAVVTTATTYSTLYQLKCKRSTARLQEIDYRDNDPFPAESHETGLDRLTMISQEDGEAIGRTIRAPDGEALSELPSASVRANTSPAFNSAGDLVVMVPVSGSAADVLIQLADTSDAAKGDAKIGWGAIVSIVNGTLTRHASLSAAVTTIGATVCELIVRDDIAMAANATLPATLTLRIENRAKITTTGFTLTINGRFNSHEGQSLAGSGTVIFGKDSITAVRPQWWGAKGDAAADGTSGTDCTAAMLAAIAAACENGINDVAIHPVHVGPGNWLVGNCNNFPPALRLLGAGWHLTNFVCKPGTAGVWFGDAGNAAKIVAENFALYANSEAAVTYGLRLGYGATQHGTEGYVRNLFVRDVDGAAAVLGIDLNGNVGYYDNLTTYDCKSGIRIVGVANMASKLIPYASTVTACELNLCDVDGLEIEAPGNSCVPLKLSGNADVSGLIVSLANGTTISHLVELAANCTTWSIRPFNLAFGSTPAGITVSNGNMKRADGTYFGGNATAGSRNGEGNYSSEYAGQQPQCFALTIVNSAGTLQHKITEPGANGPTNFAAKVNGFSSTLANTPTGADASTAFVSGGKIGSASTNFFWLDVPDQKAADGIMSASVQFNSTATAVTVTTGFSSININGVTRTRLFFQFNADASGAAFALTTGNIAAGKIVQVLFNGYLA